MKYIIISRFRAAVEWRQVGGEMTYGEAYRKAKEFSEEFLGSYFKVIPLQHAFIDGKEVVDINP